MHLSMIRTAALCSVLALFVPLASGCGDSCVQLADVICQCEPTARERQACQLDYQNQQENQAAPSPSQLQACEEAIATCTCDDLDENRTEQCGFARGEAP